MLGEDDRNGINNKTNHNDNKTPERRQSLLGKFTKTMQAVIAPSWLSDFIGSVNKKLTPEKSSEEEEKINTGNVCQKQMQTQPPFQGINNKKPSISDLAGPLPSLHFTNGLDDSHNQQNDAEIGLANSKINMEEPLSNIPYLKSTEFLSESESGKLSESDWCSQNNSKSEKNSIGFNVSLFESHFDRKSPEAYEKFHTSSHYVGKIKYGGAMRQQRRENVNVYPIRRKMKAKPIKATGNSGSSTAAKRILESLEKISKDMSGHGPRTFPELTFRREFQNDSIRFKSSRREHKNETPTANTTGKNFFIQTPNIGSIRNTGLGGIQPTRIEPSTSHIQSKADHSQPFSVGGKMKDKKFQRHAPKRNQDENDLFEIQELKTDFVLPLTTMPNFNCDKTTAVKKPYSPVSKAEDDKCHLTYSFSTPIQTSVSVPGKTELSNSVVDFQFSSPIGVSGPQSNNEDKHIKSPDIAGTFS